MAYVNNPEVLSSEEYAYQELKQRILDGRLPPGTRLPHKSIATELGVSSVPVYLALRILEMEGLVVNSPRFGAYVRRWVKEDITNLFLLRARLEGLAARLCAQNATNADIEEIVELAEHCRDAIARKDLETRIKADVEFHRAIIRSARFPDLQRMTESPPLLEYSMSAFGVTGQTPPDIYPDTDTHDDLVDAIKRHDPDTAEQAAREHVEVSLSRKIDWIEEVSAEIENSDVPRFRRYPKRSVTNVR
ncbi:MAG: GntR family transcriptional regulator [Armatimonadetes bacterium]|nr:GntR family transcriptional regulator [Armatimonadota bacterium]